MDDDIQDMIEDAITNAASLMLERGNYMPSLATALRIMADECADAYPDDVNGGRQDDAL